MTAMANVYARKDTLGMSVKCVHLDSINFQLAKLVYVLNLVPFLWIAMIKVNVIANLAIVELIVILALPDFMAIRIAKVAIVISMELLVKLVIKLDNVNASLVSLAINAMLVILDIMIIHNVQVSLNSLG